MLKTGGTVEKDSLIDRCLVPIIDVSFGEQKKNISSCISLIIDRVSQIRRDTFKFTPSVYVICNIITHIHIFVIVVVIWPLIKFFYAARALESLHIVVCYYHKKYKYMKKIISANFQWLFRTRTCIVLCDGAHDAKKKENSKRRFKPLSVSQHW